MISLVLEELAKVQWEKTEAANSNKTGELTNSFGNSNMIASCLKLLG